MTQQTIDYTFDKSTVDLIVEGLMELPYKRVCRVIPQIAGHAHVTLNPPSQAEGEAPEEPPKPQRKLPSSRVKKAH